MSLDHSAPRFDPVGRVPAQMIERRRRVLVLGAGALLLALLGASVANSQRASLRCVDGRLVAYQGRLLPLGEEEIEEARLAPLRVPAAACEDQDFPTRAALESRYMELAMGRADDAIRSEDREALESSLDTLEGLPEGADESLTRRHRQLVEALLRTEVQHARESRQQALRRIEQARQAGVPEAKLRAAEKSLGLPASPPAELEAPPPREEETKTSPAPAPQDEPPVAAGSSRAL